jgi:tripartite-type tricarboxylate transporter receptor subunit TctC
MGTGLPLCALAAWPADQPIRIIVPQAAGGTNDIVARLVGAELSTRLKQTVIVENRPGAASAIGMQQVARSKPDGYTLGLASDSASLLDALQTQRDWRFKTALRGVAMIGEQPITVAVPAASPVTDLKQLIAAARTRPGELTFGSSGVGSSQHLVGEWLGQLAGLKWVHVPYKGGGQASVSLVGGEISFAVLGLAPMLTQQRQGKVRIIAVSSAQRNDAIRDVPTLAESGYPAIQLSQWAGLVAASGTPDALIRQLSEHIVAIVSTPAIAAQLAKRGIEARPMGDQAFDPFLKQTVDGWVALVPTLNLPIKR